LALLTRKAPFEVKVNGNSFRGGYMLQVPDEEAMTKSQVLDAICVTLGGRAIEEVVFGVDNVTTGGTTDIHKATEWASSYVRRFGFDGVVAHIDSDCNNSINWITDIDGTNDQVVEVLKSQFERTKKLLADNLEYITHISDLLIERGTLTQDEFIAESAPYIKLEKESQTSYPFADKWAEHKQTRQLKAA
jgi:cell division protease FtsH